MPEPLEQVADQVPPSEKQGYTRASLYLRSPDDLTAAESSAKRLGYEVEEDRQDQIRRIRATTNRALAFLTPLVVAVALLGAWNLFTIQQLRAQQKVAEVGMLKAMGLSNGLLNLIFLLEASLIWIAGLGLGLLSGWKLGELTESWLAREAPQTALTFGLPLVWLAGIIVLSGVLCLGSTFVATRRARRAAPIESLSLG